MKKVLTIKELATAQCAIEEFAYILQQDLEKKEDDFKRRYFDELNEVSLKLDRIINYMNNEEENNEIIDVYDDKEMYLFIEERSEAQ